MNRVIIISTGKYPNGNAGAVRQHAFAKLFQSKGYSPLVVGLGPSTDFQIKKFDGVEYISFRNSRNNLFNRIGNLMLFQKRLSSLLKELNNIEKIMVVSIPISSLLFIKKYSIKNNISLIHDSVEWFSSSEFKMGKLSLTYIINNLYNTKFIDKNFHVVAISSYLKKHFNSRKISSVRIPVILDVINTRFEKKQNHEKMVIGYAGAMGRKDYIKEIIYGLSLLTSAELKKIEFRIIGSEKEDFLTQVDLDSAVLEKVEEVLHFFGRVPREKVLIHLQSIDFTILIRPPFQRYAKAGFPTKVVESLASSTPVICNITSDLNEFIVDNYNGIIVEDSSSQAIAESIKRALSLTLQERKEMQENSRITAEKHFDYRNYIESI